MSTTVNYKGNTIATLSNETKTLTTAGTWVEGDISITDVGGTAAISVVDTTDSHGGTIREITAIDISDTTAVASDVASDKYFYTASGVKTVGTSSGSPSATAHEIYFEFSDNTNTTITAYYDDSFISDAITATVPRTYGSKTVGFAQLDGTIWYNPANIPLNTQLVDFTTVISDHNINSSGELVEAQWYGATDYIMIDPIMTFSFKANMWGDEAFYDASKTFISAFSPYNSGISADPNNSNVAVGTIGGSGISIPSNAKFIRLSTLASPNDTVCSLIRTA